jgi:uncharacterized protein (DUF934 family)
MTQTESQPRLWTEKGFVADEWRHLRVDDPDQDPSASGLILPLDVWLERLPSALADGELPAVSLKPGDAIDPVLPHLSRILLVALAFPAFSDGRSHSKAALLRSRHGYRGIIRATGDVLIDQIPLMLRNGFTQFEIVNPTALKRLEESRVGGIDHHYQPAPAGDEAKERYSWRRRAAG